MTILELLNMDVKGFRPPTGVNHYELNNINSLYVKETTVSVPLQGLTIMNDHGYCINNRNYISWVSVPLQGLTIMNKVCETWGEQHMLTNVSVPLQGLTIMNWNKNQF